MNNMAFSAYKVVFKRYAILLALMWTASAAASLFWNLYQTDQKLQEVGRGE